MSRADRMHHRRKHKTRVVADDKSLASAWPPFRSVCTCGWRGKPAYQRDDAAKQARDHRINAQRGPAPKLDTKGNQ